MLGASIIKVLLLVSTINIGDVSNAEQTLRMFRAESGAQRITFATIDANLSEENLLRSFALKAAKNTECFLVVVVGDKGLNALETLVSKNMIQDNMYVYWTGHQYFDALQRAKELKIDQIMLPRFAVNDTILHEIEKDVKYVDLTFGVPSKTLSLSELELSYQKWNRVRFGDKPALDKRYIIVMLPGDAPDTDGKIKVFTQKSAKSLFDKVYALYKKHNADTEVIVHNGPRTGRYDPNNTKNVLCNHEHEKGQDIPLDNISKYFVSLLQEHNVPNKFLNFSFEIKYNSKKPHSVSDPLIYIATNTDSYYILPSESVSQISQLTMYIDPSRLVAFEPDSMNTEHKKLLDDALAKGYISRFEGDNVIAPLHGTLRNADDNIVVIKHIVEGLHHKCSGIMGNKADSRK